MSREAGARETKRLKLALVFAPIILLAYDQVQPADAILNCFTPNMFKMNKGGQLPMAYGGGFGGADRANWYPQQQPAFQGASGGYPGQFGYGQQPNPMKFLFQPKWKSGSLFGNKGWGNWKMGGSNFYRPNYGYGSSFPPALSTGGGYPLNDQLNVAPFAVGPPISSYTSSGDGWSVPVNYNQQLAPIQQNQVSQYDDYSPGGFVPKPGKHHHHHQQQQHQVVTPTLDPYGTKGGSKYPSSTTKNILVADGGYSSYDAHLVVPDYHGHLRNQTYGYAYPEWYSGSVDSPAKIAQQLLKFGLKKQRLQQQQQQLNRSAPLILIDDPRPFTILDEPRFVGFGTVDTFTNREARLSCSFNEAIDHTNRPLWVRFSGPYNSSQIINGKNVPPFNCASSQCRTQEVESTKDLRYKFDNGPATSTLIITEPRLSDYGIYRCSALTKPINNNPLETIYQIIRFGSLK